MGKGVLVSLLRLTQDEAADEVRGYSWNLPEALSGWRSVQELYDPRGLLRSLRDRSLRPRAHQFREAARGGFLGTFEDYGKLLNALEAEDAAEAREMAIWFTHGAAMILLCLDRQVASTGRRVFAELPNQRGVGNASRRLPLWVVPLRDCRGRRLADSGRASPPAVSGTQSGIQGEHPRVGEGGRRDRGLLRREQGQPAHRALDGPPSDRQENPEDTRRVRSTDRLGRPDDLARDSVHERHRGELLLFPAERGRPRDRSMALRPREPDRRDRSGLPVSLAAPSLTARSAHFGAMPRFDARANGSQKPHRRSLAVMMPSTLSRRGTTIHPGLFSSLTRGAARHVGHGLP